MGEKLDKTVLSVECNVLSCSKMNVGDGKFWGFSSSFPVVLRIVLLLLF